MATIAEDLDRIVLDTSCCIYFLSEHQAARREALLPLFDRASAGQLTIILPTVVVLELLTGPIRAGDPEAEANVRLFLSDMSGVSVIPLTFEIAVEAARIRSAYNLLSPDAAIVATAVVTASGIVGNDTRWRRVQEAQYFHLDDFV